MAALTLTRGTYRDRVFGGWLGKNVGSTLGAPMEGKKEFNNLRFYEPVPGQAAANKDLDFQLVWLHALREYGIELTSEDLAAEWLAHITYHWDEHGYAACNFRRGLRPPITGSFNNWFRHGSGGSGRSEIWAMIAPGAPQLAAEYAYRDGILDHAGEGVWGEMFWAAIQSAAFFLGDLQALLDVGLSMVPQNSRIARAVRIARECYTGQVSLSEARGRILNAVGHSNFSDTPQNIGFAALALLYGRGDLGASVCAAVNCGYDTATNAATVGALLGILRGKSALPAPWIDPIGDAVVLGWGVVDLDVERTVGELTDHVLEVGEKVIATKCPHVTLVEGEVAPAPVIVGSSAPEASMSPTEAAAPPPSASGGFPLPDLTAEPARPAEPEAPIPRARFLELDLPSSPQTTDLPSDALASEETAAPASESPQETKPSASAAPTPAVPAEEGENERGTTAPETDRALPVVVPPVEEALTTVEPPAIPLPTIEPAVPEPVAPPPVETAINWRENERIKPLLVAPSTTAVFHAGPFECVVDYGEDGPAIIPNVATSITVTIRNRSADDFIGHIQLNAPSGWQVAVPGAQGQRQMLAKERMARYGFALRVPDTVPLQTRNVATLVISPQNAPAITCEIPLLGGACWWVVGPFQNFGEEGFDKVYEAQIKPGLENSYLGRDGGLVRWQKMAFKENVMALEPLFNGSPGVAYGMTTLHVPTPTDARIVVHTNDGVKVWLNDRLILQRHSHEPLRPILGYGPTMAEVALRSGDNPVRVKFVRDRDPYEFCFAVTDPQGRSLLDVGNTRW